MLKRFCHKFILIMMLLITHLSCSGMKSGRYIQLNQKLSPKILARKFGISHHELIYVNKDKKFNKGDWIFIPKKIGIMTAPAFNSSNQFDPNYIYSGKFLWPVPASTKISSYYGKRGRRFHDGIDIPGPRGTHILAAESGKVTFSGRMSGYGKVIIIKHSGNIFTVYAHNSKNFVRKGVNVSRGEVIGKIGSTGRSTGPHLHFEVRANKRAINPLSYIKASRKSLLAKN